MRRRPLVLLLALGTSLVLSTASSVGVASAQDSPDESGQLLPAAPSTSIVVSADPTAAANPTAGTDPTAAANPTAGANPTAAVNPTAGANPTAAVNPTAGANPTAAVNPTAAAVPTDARAPTGGAATADRPAPSAPGGSDAASTDASAGRLLVLGLVVLVALGTATAVALAGYRLLRRDPAAEARDGAAREPTSSFTLLVPAGDDQALLDRTVDSVLALEHPTFDLLAVVGDADARGGLSAHAAARRHPGVVRVLAVPGRVRPSALWSVALEHADGDVVGVLVAGDRVHPDLLDEVDRRMSTGSDIVQGAVLPGRGGSGWWRAPEQLAARVRWGRRAPTAARSGVLPLVAGGAFVHRTALRPGVLVLGDLVVTRAVRTTVLPLDLVATRAVATASLRTHLAEHLRDDRRELARVRARSWRAVPERAARREVRAAALGPVLRALLVVVLPVLVLGALLLDAPAAVLAVVGLPVVVVVVLARLVVLRLGGGTEIRGADGRGAGRAAAVRTTVALLLHEGVLALVLLRALLPARLPDDATPVATRALAAGWPTELDAPVPAAAPDPVRAAS